MLLVIIALLQYLRAPHSTRRLYRDIVRIAWHDAMPPVSARAARAYMRWVETLPRTTWLTWRAICAPSALCQEVENAGAAQRFANDMLAMMDALSDVSRREGWTVCDTSSDAINDARLRAVQKRAGKPPSSEYVAALKPELDTYAIKCGLIKPAAVDEGALNAALDDWAALQPPTTR